MKNTPETPEKRLGITAISEATGLDFRTCKRRLGRAGILHGRDAWTLKEVLPVLFAGSEPSEHAQARHELVLEQKRKLLIQNELALKHFVPTAGVELAVAELLVSLRTSIQNSMLISDEAKREFLRQLKDGINIDDISTRADAAAVARAAGYGYQLEVLKDDE